MDKQDNSTNTPVWRGLEEDIIKLRAELFELQQESIELGKKLGRNKNNITAIKHEDLSSSLSLSQMASIKCALIEAIYDIKFMITFRKSLLEQRNLS